VGVCVFFFIWLAYNVDGDVSGDVYMYVNMYTCINVGVGMAVVVGVYD